MTEESPDNNTDIVLKDDRRLSTFRSKMISRGLETVKSLEKQAETVVRDIIVEIDLYGRLKKKAVLDPVCIDGEQISEISLGFVSNRKDDEGIRIRDTITITIEGKHDEYSFWFPIKKVATRTGNEKLFIAPNDCPACGSPITPITFEPGSAYKCTADDCPGRIKAQLINFSDSMSIDLDPELAKELVDKKMILDSADLYFLKKEDLTRLNEMDEDSAQRILDAIERSRHPKPFDLIVSLLETIGIRQHIAWEIGFHCKSIDKLYDDQTLSKITSPFAKLDDILQVQKAINRPKTLHFLEKLKRGGVVFPL